MPVSATEDFGRWFPKRAEGAGRLDQAVPLVLACVLAIFFAVWAMRGATTTDITLNDQARHALNGVALLDMVREGEILRPVRWFRDYFAHFPALSLPYHPPLFPAVEAFFYAVLGVDVASGRFAVAMFVAGSVFLFFQQVYLLTHNWFAAAACVLVFFALPQTQVLSADIMLELPALFWVLASTTFMRQLGTHWSARDALLAGIFAGAAVWTKQAVFVGAIPLLIVATRRCAGLRPRSFFIFYAIFGVSVGAYVLLCRIAGFSGISESWVVTSLPDRILGGVKFYGAALQKNLGIVAVGLALLMALFLLFKRRSLLPGRNVALYLAWLAACIGILLALPARDDRYLWFAYPALVVIAVTTFHSVIEGLLNRRWANAGLLGAATVVFLWNLQTEPLRLTGPAAAAAQVPVGDRVLYCGMSNGSFIVAMRMRDQRRTTHVIRADKVVPALRELGLAPFVSKYGIGTIVAEANRSSWRCDEFRQYAALLKAERTNVPLRSNITDLEGTLEIYRLPPVQPGVKAALEVPIYSTGEAVRVEF